MSTVATASSNGFFYLSRSIRKGYRNEFSLKVLKSKACSIFFGVQIVVEDEFEVIYEDAWRYKLGDGVKYDDEKG